MSAASKLFADLLETAMALDVAALRTEITAGRDDGLRAASYDGPTARSADTSSTVERQALNPRRDSTDSDLQRLDELEASYVAAVHWLATRSHSGPFPNDWRTARPGHKLLIAMDAVTALERTGQRPGRAVIQAGDALHDLERMAARHPVGGRAPDDYERSWTSGLADGDCCRVCLKLKLRNRAHARGLCQGCWKLSQDSRNHTDDGEPIDPPVELVEEFRRIGDGHGPAWKATRSRWLNSLGPEHRTRSA